MDKHEYIVVLSYRLHISDTSVFFSCNSFALATIFFRPRTVTLHGISNPLCSIGEHYLLPVTSHYSYEWLSHVSDSFLLCQKYFMLNHTQGCLLHAALAIRTIIDNLRSVESIASLNIFSLRPGLLYWRSLCGHLSRQIHYGTNRVV